MSKKFFKKCGKKFVKKICQKIRQKVCQKIRQKINHSNIKVTRNQRKLKNLKSPQKSDGQSGFLKALLVRQEDGELKK